MVVPAAGISSPSTLPGAQPGIVFPTKQIIWFKKEWGRAAANVSVPAALLSPAVVTNVAVVMHPGSSLTKNLHLKKIKWLLYIFLNQLININYNLPYFWGTVVDRLLLTILQRWLIQLILMNLMCGEQQQDHPDPSVSGTDTVGDESWSPWMLSTFVCTYTCENIPACVRRPLLARTKVILIVDYWFWFYHLVLDCSEIPSI